MVRRREKTYFVVPAQALLEGMSCWDDRPPKEARLRGEPLGACLEDRPPKERENIYAVADKSATVD